MRVRGAEDSRTGVSTRQRVRTCGLPPNGGSVWFAGLNVQRAMAARWFQGVTATHLALPRDGVRREALALNHSAMREAKGQAAADRMRNAYRTTASR